MNTYIEITDPDEILKEGDEYKHSRGEWYSIISSVGSKRSSLNPDYKVRRPVTPTPEQEYRMLEVGEEIRAGDETLAGTPVAWLSTGCTGDIYYPTNVGGTHHLHRRPVTAEQLGNKHVHPKTYIMPDISTPPNPHDPKGSAAATRCPLHLLPVALMEETAWVLKGGAEKYGIRNYRHNTVCASTYISAIMRHLNKWREREDLDTESGRSHLAHIAANCAILMDAAQHGTLEDDRA